VKGSRLRVKIVALLNKQSLLNPVTLSPMNERNRRYRRLKTSPSRHDLSPAAPKNGADLIADFQIRSPGRNLW
jgi:hypothetical protein